MNIKLVKNIQYIFICLLPGLVNAAVWGEETYGTEGDIGDTSYKLASTLFGISNLWLAIGAVAGVAFLFITIIKYFEFRKNPQQTPFGQVMLYLFLSIALLGVWFVLHFGPSGYVYLQNLFE